MGTHPANGKLVKMVKNGKLVNDIINIQNKVCLWGGKNIETLSSFVISGTKNDIV